MSRPPGGVKSLRVRPWDRSGSRRIQHREIGKGVSGVERSEKAKENGFFRAVRPAICPSGVHKLEGSPVNAA